MLLRSLFRRHTHSATNCCALHGDVGRLNHKIRTVLDGRVVHFVDDHAAPVAVPSELLAVTRFWYRRLWFISNWAKETPIPVDVRALCRLHMRHECQFGPDCRWVHPCLRHPSLWVPLATPWTMVGRFSDLLRPDDKKKRPPSAGSPSSVPPPQ